MSNARQLAANLPREGGFGVRNFIINGEMQVAQRGTSISFGEAYTLDRWRIVGGASPARVATQENNTSYSTLPHEKFLKCTNPQGQDMWTTQRIENARQFSGKTLTLSYWVWSTTGSYSATSGSWGKFQAVNGGTEYNVSGWGGASVSVTTTPQYVTHTINFADISSYAHTEGDFFEWNIYNSTANDICITGVQLEIGDTATPFEHRTYADQLQACERYYQLSGGVGRTNSTTGCDIYSVFKTPMRATPTVSINNGSFSVAQLGRAQVNINSISLTYMQTNLSCGCVIVTSDTGMTANIVAVTYGTAFAFDAEL